jgi:hypothetical protein
MILFFQYSKIRNNNLFSMHIINKNSNIFLFFKTYEKKKETDAFVIF